MKKTALFSVIATMALPMTAFAQQAPAAAPADDAAMSAPAAAAPAPAAATPAPAAPAAAVAPAAVPAPATAPAETMAAPVTSAPAAVAVKKTVELKDGSWAQVEGDAVMVSKDAGKTWMAAPDGMWEAKDGTSITTKGGKIAK